MPHSGVSVAQLLLPVDGGVVVVLLHSGLHGGFDDAFDDGFLLNFS